MSVHWHTIWATLFGQGTWGAGGNMVAWVLCGAISFGWLRAKMHAHHLALKAQAERHHTELMAQATAHSNELKHQAARHHQQLLDQAQAHHEALKAHVTASRAAPKAKGAPKAGPITCEDMGHSPDIHAKEGGR